MTKSGKDAIQPVFDTIAARAAEACHTSLSMPWRIEGDMIHCCASDGFSDDIMRDDRKDYPRVPAKTSGAGAVLTTGKPYHVEDAQSDDYFDRETARANNFRHLDGVPITTDSDLWDVVVAAWQEDMTPQQTNFDLIETFAQQAALVVENARRFSQSQTAWARQTATSDILQVVSASPGDVQPVFDVIVSTAVDVLQCSSAFVHLTDGREYWPAASASAGVGVTTKTVLAQLRHLSTRHTARGPPEFSAGPNLNFPSQAIVSKQILHFPDWSATNLPAHEAARHADLGIQAALFLALMRQDTCVSLLSFAQTSAREFTDGEIAIAMTFCDRAKNARRCQEAQARTADVSKAPERQTATAEVLEVLSNSIENAQPVLARHSTFARF